MQYDLHNFNFHIDSSDIIAKRIENIINDLGLTQKEFATKLNISQSAISKYLNGRIPPADICLRIAKLYGRSVEWLLSGTNKNNILINDITENYGSNDFYTRYNNLTEDDKQLIDTLMQRLEKSR